MIWWRLSCIKQEKLTLSKHPDLLSDLCEDLCFRYFVVLIIFNCMYIIYLKKKYFLWGLLWPDVVSSNPDQGEEYSITWYSLLVTCDRLVVSPGLPVSSTNKTDHHDITELLL